VISVDGVDDVIVKLVQSLQQIQLLLDPVQLGLFRMRQAEQVLSNAIIVNYVIKKC